jgi:hypothetical protein
MEGSDSNKTLSRLYMDLQTKQAGMQKDIDYIKQDVGEIKTSVNSFHTRFEEFRADMRKDNEEFRCDMRNSINEKANLWTEWFCKSLIATGVIGILVAIIISVIKLGTSLHF